MAVSFNAVSPVPPTELSILKTINLKYKLNRLIHCANRIGGKVNKQNVIGLDLWVHINRKSDCVQKKMPGNSSSNPSSAVNYGYELT